MEETKKEKFTRLAEARTNAALKQIALLGNLANTSNYEPYPILPGYCPPP